MNLRIFPVIRCCYCSFQLLHFTLSTIGIRSLLTILPKDSSVYSDIVDGLYSYKIKVRLRSLKLKISQLRSNLNTSAHNRKWPEKSTGSRTLLELSRLFTKIRKGKGPSLEPWGKPHLTIFISVLKSSYPINRFLFDK